MSRKKLSLASPIAAEDLRRGLYVAPLNVIDQYLPCYFDLPGRTEPVNVRMLPDGKVLPLKVVDICLPFVTAVRPDGAPVFLDVRRLELARLDDDYARRAIKLLRAQTRDRENRKGRSRRG